MGAQMRHQSRKAAETSSGPLSMCRCRRAPASDEVLNSGDDAVGSMRCAALMARASRVNSSTMLSSLMRRKSAVSSNWKSSAQTSFGRWTRSRAAVPSASRWRFAFLGTALQPSSRHRCRVRLALVTRRPSRQATAWAVRRPSRAGGARSPAGAHAGGPRRRSMAPWASVRSNGAGPRRYTPAAQRPSTAPGDAPPPCGGDLESPYSLGQLFEHRLVQLRLGKQLLQPEVLGLQLLEPLGVTGLMPAQVRLQRCQVDSVVSECRNTSARSLPAPEHPVAPTDLSDRRLAGSATSASLWSFSHPRGLRLATRGLK